MKKLFILVLSLLAASALFAQNAKSTGLTDSDVKNFAANYSKIEAEFEKQNSGFSSETGIEKFNDYAVANKILDKYGISGSNKYEKVNMICYCFGLATVEKNIDPQSAAALKAMGMDPLAQYRVNTNEKDYKVVVKNYDALAKVLGDGAE